MNGALSIPTRPSWRAWSERGRAHGWPAHTKALTCQSEATGSEQCSRSPVSGACLGSGRRSRVQFYPLAIRTACLDHLLCIRDRMRQSRQIHPAWPSRSSEDVLHRDSNAVVLATLRPPVDALPSGLTGRKRKVAGGERAVSESRPEDRSLNHRNSAAGLQRQLWRTSDEGSSVPSVQGRWEPVRARAS